MNSYKELLIYIFLDPFKKKSCIKYCCGLPYRHAMHFFCVTTYNEVFE